MTKSHSSKQNGSPVARPSKCGSVAETVQYEDDGGLLSGSFCSRVSRRFIGIDRYGCVGCLLLAALGALFDTSL